MNIRHPIISPSDSRAEPPGNRRKPLVIVTSDNNVVAGHPSITVTAKYLHPIVDIMAALPVLLPPLGAQIDPDEALEHADGVMLTGAPSNIEPHHYGQTLINPASPSDPSRDAVTLPLLRAALVRKIPVMAICRGFQETNVALGGTLHQDIHNVDGLGDHRENKASSVEQQYSFSHDVEAVAGSWLEKVVGQRRWRVNSVHGQGVDRLAPSLLPQAYAPDGLVEAFTLRKGDAFLLGVQWHPEWEALHNPVSLRLFNAFGDACRKYAAQRDGKARN